jgi:hypothetical protein
MSVRIENQPWRSTPFCSGDERVIGEHRPH